METYIGLLEKSHKATNEFWPCMSNEPVNFFFNIYPQRNNFT